jgi:CheY-like chemotaxis protein
MTTNNRVLLVDDDEDDQLFLTEALNELFPNLECTSVGNGKSALEFIEKNPPPPRYIFLDLNMPYVNGFEFLEEFRKEKGNYHTKVFVYTTSSNKKDRETAKKLGANEYITKLTDLQLLKDRLKHVLHSS